MMARVPQPKFSGNLTITQSPWTGIIGGAVFLTYIFAYLSMKLKWDFAGGPPVGGWFSFLPFWQGGSVLPRDYFDVFCCVGLSFQCMVALELFQTRLEKWAVAVCCFAGIAGSWLFIGNSQGYWPEKGLTFLGWSLTRFEAGAGIQFSLLSLVLVGNLAWSIGKRDLQFQVPLKKAFWSGLMRWASGVFLFFLFLLAIQRVFPQTELDQNFVSPTWAFVFQAWCLFGLPYAVLTNALFRGFSDNRMDPGFMVFLSFRRLYRFFRGKPGTSLKAFFLHRFITLLLREYAVKIFFGSVTIIFLFSVWRSLAKLFLLPFFRGDLEFTAIDYKTICYVTLMLIDVELGLIGYFSPSRWLGNKSASVENSWQGWLSALICYPPFYSIPTYVFLHGFHPEAGSLLGRNLAESLHLPRMDQFFPNGVFILGMIEIGLFSIYVWATASFGLRFSNLTNRGIICSGPYAFVRHPAYMAKNLAWWLGFPWTSAPIREVMVLFFWNGIYLWRAVTEETHLSRDPAYRQYCEKVKYRFVPGIY